MQIPEDKTIKTIMFLNNLLNRIANNLMLNNATKNHKALPGKNEKGVTKFLKRKIPVIAAFNISHPCKL